MDPETVAFFAIVGLAALGGTYITSLPCRMRNQPGRWYWAVAGTISSGIIAATLVWLGLSLAPGDLGKGTTIWVVVFWGLLWSCGCAVLPAILTLLYYRRKFSQNERGI